MTVVKSSPFTNLSSDMYALIFGYLPEPESLGNALSTCKRLRYNLNNQESLWKDMAKKLAIPQAQRKTWRESVITYIQWQKNIFQETVLEVPNLFQRVQYDGEGNISLSSVAEGWTYDKSSKKKILEYDRKFDGKFNDFIMTFFSNIHILNYNNNPRTKKHGNEEEYYPFIFRLKNVKNNQELLFPLKRYLSVKYILENSIICRFSDNNSVIIFDTKIQVWSHHFNTLSYNLPRKNSDFWMYENNQVLIYDVKENKVIKTIPFVALPNLLTAVAIQNVFIQITKNEIVGYRFNEDRIKNYVAGEASPFTQEIWRYPFSEAHEKIDLLLPKDHSILFGVQNTKYADKFQFFNSQNGKFLGERLLPVLNENDDEVFVHFDACHFINENKKFVIRDFSPILPEKLKKLDVEELKKIDIEERKKHTILAKTLDKIKWLFKGSLLKKIGVIALVILWLVGVEYSIKKFS